jgi:hypothetical protein
MKSCLKKMMDLSQAIFLSNRPKSCRTPGLGSLLGSILGIILLSVSVDQDL